MRKALPWVVLLLPALLVWIWWFATRPPVKTPEAREVEGPSVTAPPPAPAVPVPRPREPARDGRFQPWGFAWVPAGEVLPGSTPEDWRMRARGNRELERLLLYEVWRDRGPVALDGFWIGRYAVTNAQWKRYLDGELRVRHRTQAGETLAALAETYVRFDGEGMKSEWKAIYALNHGVLQEAWREAKAWAPEWDPADPPEGLALLPLPEGVELPVYRCRVPRHWYGWCKLSGLRHDGEYCDPGADPAEAFRVPDTPFFAARRLRDTDFAAYPVRDASPRDMLAFAEWAGCHLPSEYEFERAGRGDRGRGAWSRDEDAARYAFADHSLSRAGGGPFPVDDERFARGDGPFGTRHHLGNVWQLTRTFWDLHPYVKPAPPPPEPNLTSYALIAKGGSHGDGWRSVQVSARTDTIGTTGWLTLDSPNRADTLGLRLVRHARPGEDLLRHSALRLTYEIKRALWTDVPPSLAFPRMAGVDAVSIVDDGPPYVHVRDRARAVAFVPRWGTALTAERARSLEVKGQSGNASADAFFPLGILRSDLPLRAGALLDEGEAARLRAARARGEGPGPDRYESAMAGTPWGPWREKTLDPGEWWVGWWYGWIALADRSRTMPPVAILPLLHGEVAPAETEPAALVPGGEPDTLLLRFHVEEGEAAAPGESDSSLWALCETLPGGWPGRTPSARRWEFHVVLPFAFGALYEWHWNGLP